MTVVDIRWAHMRRNLDQLQELERQAKQLMADGKVNAAERRIKEMKKVRARLTILAKGLEGEEVPHWLPELREEPKSSSQQG